MYVCACACACVCACMYKYICLSETVQTGYGACILLLSSHSTRGHQDMRACMHTCRSQSKTLATIDSRCACLCVCSSGASPSAPLAENSLLTVVHAGKPLPHSNTLLSPRGAQNAHQIPPKIHTKQHADTGRTTGTRRIVGDADLSSEFELRSCMSTGHAHPARWQPGLMPHHAFFCADRKTVPRSKKR